jgi:hypothetical protein
MPEDPIATAVAQQISEVGAFEATLHGHDRDTWAAYRELVRADTALSTIADTALSTIAALAADQSKPGAYRAQETARMREAALAEVKQLHGAAMVAEARLEGTLRAKLVPQPDAIPANRQLHRQDLAAAFAGVEPVHLMQAAEQVMLSAPPGQVAELLSPYGRALIGAENAALLDQTAIGWLRRRGGHDPASALAVHALAEVERRHLKGRSDGLYHIAISKLSPGR